MASQRHVLLQVGRGAPEDYLGFLQSLANVHDERLKLDELRAYHFGQRYLVELEVILPAAMSVQESHDIALGLQHKASPCTSYVHSYLAHTCMGCRLACCCRRSKLLQHR